MDKGQIIIKCTKKIQRNKNPCEEEGGYFFVSLTLLTVTDKKETNFFVDFVVDSFTVKCCTDLKCFARCFFLFLLIFPCRLSRSGCFLVVSFRAFKYQQSFYGERNEEFMVCLPNDHLVAEATELREGKMNSNQLHDLKNSGFC